MNNIASCLLRWINEKGCYSQSYGNNHKVLKISIFVDNCGDQNKNNVMIRFLNMIKKGGFFGTVSLHLYIKINRNNDCYHAFNSLKVMYRKQNIFTFEKCCEILNARNNVEVIQMFHEIFFDLESLLNDFYDRPYLKTVNSNHVFQVKNSHHTLVIVKSYMAGQILIRIIRKKIPTAVHRGRE